MIRGYCRTNLDGFEREEWPTQFVAAASGVSLVVIGVTHKIANTTTAATRAGDPYVEVELHRGVKVTR